MYVRAFAVVAVLVLSTSQVLPARPTEQPTSGITGAGLEAFDEAMLNIMAKWHLPGGQLAVAKDGRLVLNRAYGYADREKRETATPGHLFRVGSVSKTLTTVAILSLIEQGGLRLSDKAFKLLPDLRPPKNATVDPRIYDISVLQLLQHEGGWASHDLLELPWSRMAAATVGESDPAACEVVIRYALSVPLDFAPGTKSNYSNFGYCVLGRVIERVAAGLLGERANYEAFVQSRILKRAGITRMRIGRTRLTERAPGEVRYYSAAGQPLSPSVYPGEGYVPFAYGGFHVPASDAAGGWIGSAVDLVRFALAIDGKRGPALLKPETVRAMLFTPVASSGSDASSPSGTKQIGLCWTVVPRQGGVDFWHTGGLVGSNASWLAGTSKGVTLAFTFNSLPLDYTAFFSDVLPGFLDRIAAVKAWPNIDLWAGN